MSLDGCDPADCEPAPGIDGPVSIETEPGTGTLRESSRGVIVRCTPGDAWCRYKRTADDALGSIPFMQDLDASMWGLGEGIHGRVHLRGRASAGARDLWPQAGDAFDVIAAYVDLERAQYRLRAGRQWHASGLGFASFDGVSGEYRLPWLEESATVDAWMGRSLVQGIHESVAGGAVAAVEDLAPERAGILFGVQARYRPRAGAGLSVAYQRELRSDRSWLYSERVSADGSMRIGREGSADASFAMDLATGSVNEARARAQHPVRDGLAAHGEIRTYRPFFELWTIWGAFSPVGFSEASGGLTWSDAARSLSLAADAGYRRYADTDAGADFLPMKSDGWRVGGDVRWRARPSVLAHSSWRSEIGFGASRTDVDGGVRWARGDDAWVGAVASAFQSVFELRVGTGRVFGLGLDGGMRLPNDMRLAGDVAMYRHAYGDMAPSTNWNQLRGSVRLEWTIGRDPGMAALAAGGVR